MNTSEIFKAQARCVGLMLIGLFIVSLYASYAISRPPVGMYRRPRPPSGLVWRDAGHYAKDAKDSDLLMAFVRSNVPDARKIGAEILIDAEPSEKMLNVWSLELSDSDNELQQRGFLSIYRAAKKLGYKPKNLPTMPGWQRFKENPDYYTNIWRAWWEENRGAMMNKAQKAAADQSAIQPDLKAP